MFIVFTQPNKYTKSYNEAVEIADTHYNKTGEIVAVEQVQFTFNSGLANPIIHTTK